MNLDERLRADLQRTVEVQPLREDDAFDYVQSTHRRGLVLARVMRRATALATVLTLFAGVGIFASWRGASGRYRSTATVRVAADPGRQTTTTWPYTAKLGDARAIALAASTRRAALVASHLLPDDTRIEFRVTNEGPAILQLAATAPTPRESTTLARNWAYAFTRARIDDARHQVSAAKLALNRAVTRLHDELRKVDAELAKLDPVTFGGLPRYDSPNGNAHGYGSAPPPVPENGSVRELNLANERIQILATLKVAGSSAASTSIIGVSPQVFAQLISVTPATRVDKLPPATAPVATGWLAGLVLVLVGAVLAYRLRTRSLRQLSAYSR